MSKLPEDVALYATTADKYDTILTLEALEFAAALQREFNTTRKQLLQARIARQERCEAYEHAAFLTRKLIRAPKFQEFLTLPAYARVLDREVYTA